MQRETFQHDGVTLSYLDAGGEGVPIVALHAYWMEAGTYADLAAALAPEWRVIALDQRGHGHSDHPADLSWDAFIGDLGAFLDHLGITAPVVLAGNSLGGTVAFRYAARNPGWVSAMIVEESPAEEDADLDFMRAWEGAYPTRDALAAKIGERLAWSVEPSFRHTDAGWTLAFSPTQLANAQAGLNGDFWDDWLATDSPVLLIVGNDSKAVDRSVLEEMAKRRPGTALRSLDAGHVCHHDQPAEFATVVHQFLSLPPIVSSGSMPSSIAPASAGRLCTARWRKAAFRRTSRSARAAWVGGNPPSTRGCIIQSSTTPGPGNRRASPGSIPLRPD